jgi:hypothetical protein
VVAGLLREVMRVIFFSMTVCMLLGCRSESGPRGEEGIQDPSGASQETPEEASPSGIARGVGATFGQGRNVVYGIKIPTGMNPAPGPPKVYRFEGNQSVPQVARLVRQQVSMKEEKREGEGYLFRYAKAKKGGGEAASVDPVAVRVFETADGRTSLDIWREKVYAKSLPNRALRSGIYGAKGPSRARKDRARTGQKAELAETMRVLKKIQTQQPLTGEDLQSGAFD